MKARFQTIAFGLILFLVLGGVWACAARAERPTQTVMLYMVGTDLETSRALATADLAEIAQSAADNADIQLVVYAGGASRWQSLLQEGENGIFALHNGQWRLDESRPPENMCDPGTLSAFLQDAVRGYPADSYALVLWNHGSGPLVGYGEDERFGGDKLTLVELRQAFEDSPFAADTRLEWIGFDACLMGSMETAHTMAPYARYMIASQESEPNEGWIYDFLRETHGGESGGEVGERIIRSYLDGYAALYKDYPDYAPKLTLSCLDLSMLAPAENALSALAERMTQSIGQDGYDELTRTRLQTGAFGRFTTGSELDLIDLTDFARGCEAMFPEQTQAVLAALRDLVVHRGSARCDPGGISVYFPFYNKDAYTDHWSQTYDEFGFSEAYCAFLKSYAGVWLGEQLAKWSDEDAPTLMPGATPRSFTMQLTPEQLDAYASASYVILKRTEGEQYQFVYASSDVTLDEGGLLRANYDGMALYCADALTGELGEIVRFIEYERTEASVRYLVPAMLLTYAHDSILDVENEWISVYFQVEYDRQSGDTRVLGIIPVAADGIASGKQQLRQEDADHIYVVNYDRYKARSEDGSTLPFYAWPSSGVARGYEYESVRQGGSGAAFKMTTVDMSEDDLFLMLVVNDTQGNQTASDLLLLHESQDVPQPTIAPPEPQTARSVAFPIDSTQPAVLYEQDGIKVTLTGVHPDVSFNARLLLHIENRTGQPLELRAAEPSVNGYRCSLSIQENSALTSSRFGTVVEDQGALDIELCVSIASLRQMRLNHIREIELCLEFSPLDDYESIFNTGLIAIQTDWDLTDAVGPLPEFLPGLITPQQIDLGDVRIELLSSSIDSYSRAPMIWFLAENRGAYPVDIEIERVSADDFMIQKTSIILEASGGIPSGKRAFGNIHLDAADLNRAGLSIPPKRMEFVLRVELADGSQTLARSDVLHVDFVSPQSGDYPEMTIFDVDGVLVTMRRVAVENEERTAALFRAYVRNDSASDIQIKADKGHLNGKSIDDLRLVPLEPILSGKQAVLDLEIGQDALRSVGESSFKDLAMQFLLLDAGRREVLHHTQEILLTP